jgi:hypothetical protein
MLLNFSLCLHYFCENGQEQEQFLTFVDVSPDRTVNILHRHEVQVAQDYSFEGKTVSQSHNGLYDK